jgi:hypothetical protein
MSESNDSAAGTAFAAATTDLAAARSLAAELGGTLYVDEREQWQHLPFRALLTAQAEDPAVLAAVGDVGTYRAELRHIKPGSAHVFGLFPMIRAPGLSHEQADAHWRDKHGPLALEQHRHMTEYVQLNVLETLSGPAFDGIALCGFASEDDLRHRFYSEPGGAEIIAADIQRFADTKRSPRRLIATVERYQR